jgi:hypothetical protein
VIENYVVGTMRNFKHVVCGRTSRKTDIGQGYLAERARCPSVDRDCKIQPPGPLVRGDASGVGDLDVEIAGAADSWTKDVTVVLIFIIVGVLLSAWVGGRVCDGVVCFVRGRL